MWKTVIAAWTSAGHSHPAWTLHACLFALRIKVYTTHHNSSPHLLAFWKRLPFTRQQDRAPSRGRRFRRGLRSASEWETQLELGLSRGPASCSVAPGLDTALWGRRSRRRASWRAFLQGGPVVRRTTWLVPTPCTDGPGLWSRVLVWDLGHNVPGAARKQVTRTTSQYQILQIPATLGRKKQYFQ